MKAVDLFCGCGGTLAGLRDAGYAAMLGLDWDEDALRACVMNGLRVRKVDLRDVDRVVAAVRRVKPDLLSASPPCTDYSCSGKRVEGERASLTVACARIMVGVRARCICIENVPEMLRSQSWEEARAILEEAGYSLLVKRVNAASCGVAQCRKRVFVIGMLRCGEDALRRVDAVDLSGVPKNAVTVRDCLEAPCDDTWYYHPRNQHSPGVRSTDLPAPTLRTNCLTLPSPHYKRRHDDAGYIKSAHVLLTEEAVRISSFSDDYFHGMNRTLVGRLLGNCVPPKMAQRVGGLCMELLKSPEVSLEVQPPSLAPRTRGLTGRRSRVDRLVEAGLLEHGGTRESALEYVVGTSEAGDADLGSVLNWLPPPGCRVVLKERACQNSQPDDLYLYMQGEATPFRSRAQMQRQKKKAAKSSS